MPSTHLSLHVHVVFSTKNREPFIVDDWRDRLHAFMGGAIRTAGCVPECIGGTSDHVHVLMGIRATHRLADVMRDIKQASSRWVHATIGVKAFAWQDGYGEFTIGAAQIGSIKAYIENQIEHHRRRSFQEEYLDFLVEYGVEYDEGFLW